VNLGRRFRKISAKVAAGVAALSLAGGSGIGGAVVTLWGTSHPPQSPESCINVIREIDQLKHDDPALARKYLQTHGKGLPKLAPSGWARTCGGDPLDVLAGAGDTSASKNQP
jgi:hypothetical protein